MVFLINIPIFTMGWTMLSGKGAYSHFPGEVIYSVITPFELAKLKDLVITIDPKAF